MADIVINITGLPELLAQVRRLPNDVQEEVDAEILDSVMRINGAQRRLAPKDQGGLARGIGFERRNGQNVSFFEIYSNSEHSGYMEFGTRLRVRVPAQLQAMAMQMMGVGIRSRLRAKEAIYAWAKRRGISESAWYAIYIAIMTVGVSPHPFFFQPFFDETPRLLDRIRAIVRQYSSSQGVTIINPGDFTRNNPIITI